MAPIATLTSQKNGTVAGQPQRFRRGHRAKLWQTLCLTNAMWTAEDRGYETPCWIWNGPANSKTGYGRVGMGGQRYLPHRAMYEQEVGPIPEGLDIDHLCRQRMCVNPSHLEPVTRAENIRRSRTAKLTVEDVRFIRGSSLSDAKLAKLYGINPRTVNDARAGRTWRD